MNPESHQPFSTGENFFSKKIFEKLLTRIVIKTKNNKQETIRPKLTESSKNRL